MAHSYKTSSDNVRRVYIALALTGTFMLVEVAGGIISGSLALLADAGHMLTDTMALGLAAAAFRISVRPADEMRSYGYSRFQMLAAFVNGLTLIVIVIWILVEATQRFISPTEVMGKTMFAVATAGLLVNVAAFVVLHGGDQKNLNIRGAALHVVGDLLGSVAAIVAAVVIMLTGWMPIDPLLSLVVAILIMRSAWLLVRKSGHILLEGAPDGVDTAEIRNYLMQRLPVIGDVHHVHVWGLTPEHLMLTMHIALESAPEDATAFVREVKTILHDEFSIEHSTIELETDACADEELPAMENNIE